MDIQAPKPPDDSKIVKFIRSDGFTLTTLVGMTIPFMFHTAELVKTVSGINNDFYAYTFAIFYDLAIFLFAVHGRKKIATNIAMIVFFLNVCFFNYDNIYIIVDPAKVVTTDIYVRLIVSTVIAGAGTFIIHGYVTFFYEKIQSRNELDDLIRGKYQNEKKALALEKVVVEKDAIISSLKSQLEEVNIKVKEQAMQNEFLAKNLKKLESDKNVSPQEASSLSLTVQDKNFPVSCSTCRNIAYNDKNLNALAGFCDKTKCDFKKIIEEKKEVKLEKVG